MKTTPLAVLGILAATALAGCADTTPSYTIDVTADDFVQGIDNPYLPWIQGAWWEYEVVVEGGLETIEVRVLNETRLIMGVEATVVRDTVRFNGVPIEDTWDWYAQDRDGNVWYLGEDTVEYEDGVIVNDAGAWEWGVDGALPGIIMFAEPDTSQGTYYQEFYPGEAEDQGEVIGVGHLVEHHGTEYTDTVSVREFSRLDPGVEEVKTYVAGIGMVVGRETGGPDAGTEELLVDHFVPPLPA